MTTIKTNIAALFITLFGLTLMLNGCASQSGTSQTMDQAEPSKAVAIESISSSDTTDETVVIISADGPLTFSSLKQPDPISVVLYCPESTVGRLSDDPMADIHSDLIQRVVASDGNGSHTARIEFQLAYDVPYTATREGNNVRLAFDKSAIMNTAQASEPEKSSTENKPMVMAESSPVSPVREAHTEVETLTHQSAIPAESISKSTAWVNKIDFLSESEGKSTLVLGTTHAVAYRINKIGSRKLEIRLLNTRIPSYRQRALITTRFNSAVDRVVPFQLSKEKNESVVSVEMRESVPYFVEQTDNLLLVHFQASGIPPKPMEQAQLPAWKQEMISGDTDMEYARGSESMQTPVALTPAESARIKAAEELAAMQATMSREEIEIQALLAPSKKNYTGEKIALDFFDTDVKNVFRIIREVSGNNFAVDKDVSGKVTMTLDKPVPWDQVLDLVLRMNQLGMTHEGDIMRIATLETLKKEDDLRKAKMEALRAAREEAKALEPLVTKYIPVSYSNADAEVRPHIEKILTKGRGSVTVDAKNNQVIITDTAAKVAQAVEIVRRIDKVTSQVIIEARVVEVSNSFSKELGVDWNTSYGDGIIPGTGINTTTDMAMNFPSASSSNIGINFSRLTGVPFVLNARLNAIETTGKGRILSAPKILTLDNKKAKIKQGVEYAYLERDSSGGSSVAYKSIDLLLEVTPHVTPDNRVSLIIYITKNDVAGITDGVPNVATNEAETELLVNDGDTVVIGGIIKKNNSTGVSAFPALSKIPFLGWMFKNNNNKTSGNELLIFITPRIVQLEQEVAQSVN